MLQWVSCFQNIIFWKRFSVNSCLLAHVIFIVKAKILLPYLWKTRKRWLWLLTSKHTLFYIVIWLGLGERYTIYCQFIAFELSKSRIFEGWRRVWDLRFACTQNLVARPIYNKGCNVFVFLNILYSTVSEDGLYALIVHTAGFICMYK